ncbi:hypothetical protein Slin_6463 [Spirosoma linguale DSM 74]|uniref:Uncharacterized protein n=1 Tax=Spirosoma linguale (strain ATCC 33905 / DSM 74 / LMG 10896 / Claus 1) TaxID=504472 RepID=D2QUD8_SPILD|nr:hypothetical protein Slin_6463 [Spirosoma linguale DSM 74]
MKSILPLLFVLSLVSIVSQAQETNTFPPALTNQELRDLHDETLTQINSLVNYLGVIADRNTGRYNFLLSP